MNKWLSLIVMTTLLSGAAYFAVATETGRTMLNSTATTRALLQEIDAMLVKDASNPELLQKRAELTKELAQAGEAVAPQPKPENEVKDIEYLRSIGATAELEQIVQEQAAANLSYLEELLAREQAGMELSPSEKSDLIESGLLDQDRTGWDEHDNLDNTGGPSLTFGYRWVDNQAGDTATYAWEEIDGTWTEVTALSGSDDGNAAFSWGWPFTFMGTAYTSGFVTTNGYIAFGTGSGDFSNDCRRSNGTPTGPTIFAYWDDGNSSTGASSDGGRIMYKDFGDHLTMTWDSLGTCCTGSTDILDYQCQIWNSGKIKFQYRQIQKLSGTSANGTTPTIGIQQSNNAGGLDSLIYYCNNGTAQDSATTNHFDGRAVWYYQQFLDNDFQCNAVLSPTPLRVSPGATLNIVGRFRNAGNVTQSSPIGYRFNGGANHIEATGVLANGVAEDHDFAGTETAPVAIGDYELVLWTGLVTDEDRTNDTCRVTVQVRDCFDEQAPNDAFTDAGTTCGAVNDWSNTCMGTADASEDYIYRWTTTSNGAWNVQVIIPTAATQGLLVSTACPPDSFNCVAFVNLFQDTVSLNCLPLAAGTYYIMLDRSTGCGTYTLNVTQCTDIGRCCYNGGANCADNDAYTCSVLAGNWDRTTSCAASPCPTFLDGGNDCATAVPLPVPSTVRGNTVGAGDNDPGFQCALGSTDPYEGFNTAPDEWYTITGNGTEITVSLCSGYTAYDTQIAVFCSGDCATFTCVAGNDDATCTFSGLRSTATFCSDPGQTYYVVVDGWGSGSGNFELIVTSGATCSTPVNCSPLGRCCYLDGGVAMCADNLAGECSTLGGQWNQAVLCASSPCPVGRCCYLDGGVGVCADLTDLECQAVSGQWTSTTTCAATPCPVGRCCYDNGGVAGCETNTQLECAAIGGTWTSTTTCEMTPCPTARCCYEVNGSPTCQTTTTEVCTGLGGIWTSGLTCETDPCPVVLLGSDACAEAVEIPSLNQQYAGTNSGFTTEVGLPVCATWYGATVGGVWYKLVGTGNTMTVALCDPLTTYDTEIGIFCGETCDALECVTSDDDFCTDPSLASQASFCSVLGAEYKLLITAFSAGVGTYAFTVTDDGVACAPTVQCPVTVIPCDPVIDLRAYVVVSGTLGDHVQLHFTAPQDAVYKIWYSTVANNDGNPDDGADLNFVLADAQARTAGVHTFDFAAGFDTFRYFVVTADCSQ